MTCGALTEYGCGCWTCGLFGFFAGAVAFALLVVFVGWVREER